MVQPNGILFFEKMKMKRNASGAKQHEPLYEQVQVANITGGPLDYSYPMHSVSLHFGLRDKSGSEHTVDGKSFPGEVNFSPISNLPTLWCQDARISSSFE